MHTDLAELEHEWRRLEQVADCTAFQSFTWLSAWQRHVGARTETRPAIVTGRSEANELLFIIPLATRKAGLLTELTFLGHDLCDYNAPLLGPGFAAAASDNFLNLWNEIRRLLQADPQHRHDVILLDKMPETIGGLRNPFMDLAPTLNPSGAYATTLAGDWEAFYAARRSSSSRKRDRSKRKKLAENGNVRMVTPVEPAAADRTLMLLMDQKQRAFARMGVANMFRNPGYREFFTDLTTNPQLAGLTHVSQLEVGETIAATNLGLVFRGAYYHVLTSYDDGPISRFGPGATHLQEIMRYALERGCTLFDFTIGDEPYKRDWSDRELALYDHVARGDLARRALCRKPSDRPARQAGDQAVRAALAGGCPIAGDAWRTQNSHSKNGCARTPGGLKACSNSLRKGLHWLQVPSRRRTRSTPSR